MLQSTPFATEFAACRGKMRNCLLFATFISNSRFYGLLFIFTIYMTIKSSHCKLTTVIINDMNDRMCVNDIDMKKDNVVCFRVTGYNKFLIL